MALRSYIQAGVLVLKSESVFLDELEIISLQKQAGNQISNVGQDRMRSRIENPSSLER